MAGALGIGLSMVILYPYHVNGCAKGINPHFSIVMDIYGGIPPKMDGLTWLISKKNTHLWMMTRGYPHLGNLQIVLDTPTCLISMEVLGGEKHPAVKMGDNKIANLNGHRPSPPQKNSSSGAIPSLPVSMQFDPQQRSLPFRSTSEDRVSLDHAGPEPCLVRLSFSGKYHASLRMWIVDFPIEDHEDHPSTAHVLNVSTFHPNFDWWRSHRTAPLRGFNQHV